MNLARRCLLLMILVIALTSAPACNRATPPAVIPPDSFSPREGEQEEPQVDTVHVLPGDIGLKPQYFFAAGEWVFFRNELDEGRLYRMQLKNDPTHASNTSLFFSYFGSEPLPYVQQEIQALSSTAIGKLAVTEESIYYLDANTHVLLRAGLDGSTAQVLLDKPVEEFVVYSDWIYYVVKGDAGVWRSTVDGTLNQHLSEDDASELNVVGSILFYVDNTRQSIITMDTESPAGQVIVATLNQPDSSVRLIANNTHVYYYSRMTGAEDGIMLFRLAHGAKEPEEILLPGHKIMAVHDNEFYIQGPQIHRAHDNAVLAMKPGQEANALIDDEPDVIQATVTGDAVYYLCTLYSTGLYRAGYDGSNPAKLADGLWPASLQGFEDWVLSYSFGRYYLTRMNNGFTYELPDAQRDVRIHGEWVYYLKYEEPHYHLYRTRALEPGHPQPILNGANSYTVQDGYIYLTGDEHHCYRMAEDKGEIELITATPGRIIGLHDGWLYLSSLPENTPYTFRVRIDGSEEVVIADLRFEKALFSGSFAYFEQGILAPGVYRFDTLNSTLDLIPPGNSARLAMVEEDWLYFYVDGAFIRTRVDGSDQATIARGMSPPIGIQGEWLYWLTPVSGIWSFDEYVTVHRTLLDGSVTEQVFTTRGRTAKLTEGYLFYPHVTEYLALVRVSKDGTGKTILHLQEKKPRK